MTNIDFILDDHGGRRSGDERRKFNYSSHIPERRLSNDRRSGSDRRSGYDRRDFFNNGLMAAENRRIYSDRRAAWN